MQNDKNSESNIEPTDEELVEAALQGDESALETIFKRYKGTVRKKARSYFLQGADKEDIIQEGMIGLYKAVRDYNAKKSVSFKAFAEICITRQMITAIKTATRQKHIPLNSYLSFSKPVSVDDPGKTVMDVLESRAANPEDMMINQENLELIESRLNSELSPFELEVVMMFVSGRSYMEISEKLGRSTKSIDNALQRVKRKLEKML